MATKLSTDKFGCLAESSVISESLPFARTDH